MASISLQRLTKSYGNNAVIPELSIDIKDGEFLVLVGPSGCGKSTLLRMIAGLESISDGSVLIDGKVVNALPPKDRDIAMVFQSYVLYLSGCAQRDMFVRAKRVIAGDSHLKPTTCSGSPNRISK